MALFCLLQLFTLSGWCIIFKQNMCYAEAIGGFFAIIVAV